MNHLTFPSGVRPVQALCLLAVAGALGACGFVPTSTSTGTGTGSSSGSGGEGGESSTQAGGDECSSDYACSYLAQNNCEVASCVLGVCEVHHSTEPQCARCDTDADCAGLAKPNDPCTVPKCYQGEHTCELIPNPDPTVCQCHDVFDCDWQNDTVCMTTTCEGNKCVATFAPAGPTPDQTDGDCAQVVCDGTTKDAAKIPLASDIPGDYAGDCAKPACDGVNPFPTSTPDPSDVPAQVPGDCLTKTCSPNGTVTSAQDLADIPDDNNECTADSCDPTFNDGVHTPINNGKACLAGSGFCFQGECMTTCQPTNPASCGGEGLGEPANNSGATPLSYTGPGMCGFLTSSDQDWYTFHAHDGDFVYNILEFDAWSTASTIQMCAYVKCDDGSSPGGGCALLSPGPNGSQGCCWTGASAGFHKSWDLDCAGGDDSGDVYVRVGTPGGDACEQYGVSMSY
jgi:hypothetical protein